MIRTLAKQLLCTTLSLLLVITAVPIDAGAQQPAPPSGYSGQGVPLTPEELQQLAGPIALYPDSLVAQILGAATFPDQIGAADNFVHQSGLSGSKLMEAVDTQPWDPSVKALTQFPSVLDNMTKNLSWTSALGEAYHTQAADVMAAIQFLRAKAQAAGNLKSGSQIVVTQSGATNHRDPICKPAGRVRPHVQPRSGLRNSLRLRRIRASAPAASGSCVACFRSWHCSGRDDERRMLRLGIQQLELRLAQYHRGISRWGVLRKQRLARRLLRLRRRRALRDEL